MLCFTGFLTMILLLFLCMGSQYLKGGESPNKMTKWCVIEQMNLDVQAYSSLKVELHVENVVNIGFFCQLVCHV